MSPKHPEPTFDRWQSLRAGIQNIWEYDDQRFLFHRGRLLLRGENESGKTKALEVLLPFLLDANLSSNRLDPFGSRSRPMKWNLINDDTDEDHRIGYVWLEFGRKEGEAAQFLTIGAGLRARRASAEVEAWYFLTARRVDLDLALIDEQKVPLTRARLAEQLGKDEKLYESPADYRAALNQRLFGLPQEQYTALIDTLLQLRRPQLAKTLDPAELGRLLSASLPALDGEKVDRLAEGFERLDRHRAERDASQEAAAALSSFLGTYRRYARSAAKARALELTQADSAFHSARAVVKDAAARHTDAQTRLTELNQKIDGLEQSEREQAGRLQALRDSTEFRALREVEGSERLAAEASSRAAKAEERLANTQQELRTKQSQLGARRARCEERRKDLSIVLDQADRRAREADLHDAQRGVAALLAREELSEARGLLDSALGQRDRGIQRLLTAEKAVVRAAQDHDLANRRHQDAEEAVGVADGRLRECQAAEETAVEAFRGKVVSWAAELTELRLPAEALVGVLDEPIEGMRAAADEFAGRHRQVLTERLATVGANLKELAAQIQSAQGEATRLQNQGHATPPVPAWRAAREPMRPGAPLYLLCEFTEDDVQKQAGIEAALEAAGLLDAWVTPTGEVLHPEAKDVCLVPQPLAGPTLFDVLQATPAGEVAASVIHRVLRSVALCSSAQELPDEPAAAISQDGRFRLGPLRGKAEKRAPAYVGATARERARKQRLAELAQLLSDLEQQRQLQLNAKQELGERLLAIDAELRRFPSLREVDEARAAVKSADKQKREALAAMASAQEALQNAARQLKAKESARDGLAVELALSRWVGRLDALQLLTGGYREAAFQVLRDAEILSSLVRDVGEAEAELASLGERAAAEQEEAEETRRHSGELSARAQALREALGVDPAELLRRYDQARQTHKETGRALEAARKERPAHDQRVGERKGELLAAEEAEKTCDDSRKNAEAGFKRLAQRGMLRFLAEPRPRGVDGAANDDSERAEPAAWSYTDTLHRARHVDAATAAVDPSLKAREKEENKVTAAHQDLQRGLPREVAELLPERNDGVLEYAARRHGRIQDLLQLTHEVQEDVDEHDRLLTSEERGLIDQFLSGELYEHLADRLRQAHALVDGINEQLKQQRTASQMQLRLLWDVVERKEGQEQVPAGAKEAIKLMLRANTLLSDSDREALASFMKQRLALARGQEGQGTLQQRLLAALDYRAWFTFTVQSQRPPTGQAPQPERDPWRDLTKKTHGEGSGGQKAVMLHLPLFAAVKAFYTSAKAGAPRIILLDEAFAGIDRKMKGRLMGCLRAFDLDFLMTSFDEWGFYEELDGLATYHLMREPGHRGVYTEWFLWDGRSAQEMGPG